MSTFVAIPVYFHHFWTNITSFKSGFCWFNWGTLLPVFLATIFTSCASYCLWLPLLWVIGYTRSIMHIGIMCKCCDHIIQHGHSMLLQTHRKSHCQCLFRRVQHGKLFADLRLTFLETTNIVPSIKWPRPPVRVIRDSITPPRPLQRLVATKSICFINFSIYLGRWTCFHYSSQL